MSDLEDGVKTCKVRLEDGSLVEQPLPPILTIRIPSTGTKSATIRWLHTLGYPTKDISNGLGLKYQMVRNIIVNQPKRASREDMPELVVEYLPEQDVIEAGLDAALDSSLMAGRKERLAAEKAVRRQQWREFEELGPVTPQKQGFHLVGDIGYPPDPELQRAYQEDEVDPADVDYDALETEEH